MDILTRLKEIVAYGGMSIRALAIRSGIPQKTLDNQIKGLRGISIETVVSILQAYPEISAEWLLRGNGEMLIRKEDNSEDIARINGLVDTITTLNDALKSKSETIAMLKERITQLEKQIGK